MPTELRLALTARSTRCSVCRTPPPATPRAPACSFPSRLPGSARSPAPRRSLPIGPCPHAAARERSPPPRANPPGAGWGACARSPAARGAPAAAASAGHAAATPPPGEAPRASPSASSSSAEVMSGSGGPRCGMPRPSPAAPALCDRRGAVSSARDPCSPPAQSAAAHGARRGVCRAREPPPGGVGVKRLSVAWRRGVIAVRVFPRHSPPAPALGRPPPIETDRPTGRRRMGSRCSGSFPALAAGENAPPPLMNALRVRSGSVAEAPLLRLGESSIPGRTSEPSARAWQQSVTAITITHSRKNSGTGTSQARKPRLHGPYFPLTQGARVSAVTSIPVIGPKSVVAGRQQSLTSTNNGSRTRLTQLAANFRLTRRRVDACKPAARSAPTSPSLLHLSGYVLPSASALSSRVLHVFWPTRTPVGVATVLECDISQRKTRA
jgi:hypothetical protein